jgi:hypothetical protein
MQQLKTLTIKTSNKVKSVHVDTLYAIMENAYKQLQVMDPCATGASYYVANANIFAALQVLYANTVHFKEYCSLESIMEIFGNNITYYDEESIYFYIVENTAMQKIKLRDFVCLHN